MIPVALFANVSRWAKRHGLAGAVCVAFLLGASLPVGSSPQRAKPLLEVDNWGYQLHHLDPEKVATSNQYDLLVVDYSRDGAESERFTPAEVERMKQRPNGRPRLILSYMSIGEAENYRYYWRPGWHQNTPSWLLSENKQWKGNFIVKFWDREWKRIVFEGAESYLKKIVDAGFDGVYLDRVDVYGEVEKHNPNARRDMIVFVKEMAAKARSFKPGFLVVPQNAESLLTDDSYLADIDGVGVEDLFYGVGGDGRRNSAQETGPRTENLRRARRAGKGIFIVEYLARQEDIERARAAIMTAEPGFIPYVVAPRDLGRMKTENLEDHAEPE